MKKGLTVPYTPDLVDELNTLVRFDLETNQQGVKIHKMADARVIAATQRLHDKGLVTQVDGGYLTSIGRNAAEHAQAALALLTTGTAVSGQASNPEQSAAQA
jgi:uncharacterized protein (TIGR02647 family)